VWPSFERPWSEVLPLARWAEEEGCHGIWCADHYMPDASDGTATDGPGFECWTTLGALAGAVERLQLGSMVSPSTVHHPAILAKQVTTADVIAGGRLVLGVGAGWQVNEHRAYGLRLPPPGERVDRFEEFLRIVHGLLHDERTTFEGRYFSVVDAPCEPKGGPGPVPVLVGTSSSRMLRLTARYADAWNTWGTPERVRTVSAALDAACAAEGRDPGEIRRTAQAFFFLRDDPAASARIRAASPRDRTLVGSAVELQEHVGAYEALGIDEVIVPDFALGREAPERLARYQQLWSEVLKPLA